MSFDLLIFDPQLVEYREPAAFLEWYDDLTEWEDGVDYYDPAPASAPLQSWFHEMRIDYPPMNGPFAPSLDEIDRAQDYSIAPDSIYASFSYSAGVKVVEQAFDEAAKRSLGIFDPQDGTVYLPAPDGMALKPAFRLGD